MELENKSDIVKDNIVFFLANSKGVPTLRNYNPIFFRGMSDDRELNAVYYLQYIIQLTLSLTVLPFDRFGMFYKPDNYLCDRFPEITSLTFKDICMNRVDEILKKANGKEIVIMGSSGIDSLTVIASFVISGKLDNLRVVELKSSLTDYEMIKYWKKLGIRYEVILDGNCPADDNSFIIDGNCGDQLAYSFCMFSKTFSPEKKKYMLRFSDFKPNRCTQYLRFLQGNERFNAYMRALPIRLINDCQRFWWLSFAFGYREFGYERMLRLLANKFDYYLIQDNYAAFFCSEEFSDWAYSHYEENVVADIFLSNSYKRYCKKIIFKAITDLNLQERILDTAKTFSIFNDDIPVKHEGFQHFVDCLTEHTERITEEAKNYTSNKLCIVKNKEHFDRVII